MRLNPLSPASRKRRAQHRALRTSPSAHNNIIQTFIDKLDAKVYLEIGYFKGGNFVRIQCDTKYAVDPAPRNLVYRRHHLARTLRGRTTEYFRAPSDDFFRSQNDLLAKTPLDIVYVDGLHTFEQSLRDVVNAFKFLARGGVVFVDDCNPRNAAIAIPATSLDDAKDKVQRLTQAGQMKDEWSGEWCGDVWKTIGHLRGSASLNISVLDTHTGLGVITLKPGAEFAEPKGAPEIWMNNPYTQLDVNRAVILDLQPVEALSAVLQKHCIRQTR